MKLSEKKCVPCEGGVVPLDGEKIQKYLEQLQGGLARPKRPREGGWIVEDNKKIRKEYKFRNFKEALDFVNKVGAIAEAENHHPDIVLSWGRVVIELWTHAIGGLSENDFIVAAKINALIKIT